MLEHCSVMGKQAIVSVLKSIIQVQAQLPICTAISESVGRPARDGATPKPVPAAALLRAVARLPLPRRAPVAPCRAAEVLVVVLVFVVRLFSRVYQRRRRRPRVPRLEHKVVDDGRFVRRLVLGPSPGNPVVPLRVAWRSH